MAGEGLEHYRRAAAKNKANKGDCAPCQEHRERMLKDMETDIARRAAEKVNRPDVEVSRL